MARVVKASIDALTEHSERSQKTTRNALELAFARLRHGNPKIVAKGTAITPTSVAKEAGIRRETLYRFHEPVLTQIRTHSNLLPRDLLRQSRAEVAKQKASSKELRQLADDAQKAEEALARINHRLTARIQDLEKLLHLRDQTIADLRVHISKEHAGNVLPIKPRRG